MLRSYRRLGMAYVVVLLAILVVLPTPSFSQSSSPTPVKTYRLLRTIRFQHAAVGCSGGGGGVGDCVETSTTPEALDLRAATSPLDVSMTITMSYRTTPGDPVSIIATLIPAVGGSNLMRPGRLPLASSTQATTSTLRWTEEDVAPRLYHLGFQIGYGSAAVLPLTIWAPKITVLIEAWESDGP